MGDPDVSVVGIRTSESASGLPPLNHVDDRGAIQLVAEGSRDVGGSLVAKGAAPVQPMLIGMDALTIVLVLTW